MAGQEYGSPSDFFMRLWQVVDADTTLAGLHAVMVQVPGLRYDHDRAEAQIRSINEFWNWYPLFLPIRLAELFDGVEVPHDEQYLQAMIAGLSARSVPGMHLLFLREDEEFREELFWRLFEIEGTQLASLANQDRHHRKEDSWQASVLQAEQEGLLERPRLLRSCLEALTRDFAAFRAGWFQRLHDSLKPTVQELAENQELLNRCLTTNVTATVSMTVKHLAALHKAGLLEPAGFLAVAAGGFSGGKATALTVLTMLRELSGAGHEVMGIVEQALGHFRRDVQEEAEELLRELGAGELETAAVLYRIVDALMDTLPRTDLEYQERCRIAVQPHASQLSRATLQQALDGWQSTRIPFAGLRVAECHLGVQVTHDERYVLLLMDNLTAPSLELLLRHDDDLRENLFWRVFEVEGDQSISLAMLDKYRWWGGGQETVLELVADGVLERGRVLRSCLEALNRDFAAFRAGWFSRLFTILAPTVEEISSLQGLLLCCVESQTTATVNLAVKQLERVHRAGLLDPAGFLAVAAGGFSAGKATAMALLRLLRELAEAGHDVTGIVEQAVGHSHRDVRIEAEELLRALGVDAVSPVADPALDRSFQPCVVEVEPVVPVTDEDAVLRVSAVLEAGRDFEADAIEAELCLAWLAVATDPVIAVGALRTRASKVHHSLAEVIHQAFNPGNRVTRPRALGDLSAGVPGMSERLWERRLVEVKRILAGREPRRSLLATPTHSDGSVSGEVFRARVAEAVEVLGVKDAVGLWRRCPDDLIQASFRLSDEDRVFVEEALGMELPHPSRSVAVTWKRQESGRKENGKPEMVWWEPVVHPGGSEAPRRRRHADHCTAWDVAVFSHLDPGGAAYLVTDGVPRMYWAMHESSHRQAEAILDVLEEYRGQWTAEAAQMVGLGLSSFRAETRARAAEVMAACIPGRLSVELAAEGLAACVMGCKVNRWTSSLTDAAALNPGMVVDLLTVLLPRVDRGQRGIGGLLQLLLDEQLRLGRNSQDPALREWLAGFTGSSAAAKTAKKLRAAS